MTAAYVDRVIVTPTGERLSGKALAERIRRFRGRLTRPQVCDALGWPRSDRGLKIVEDVCVEYEITTAAYVPVGNKKDVLLRAAAKYRAQQRRLAAEQAKRVLSHQIAIAIEEQNGAPPYKNGDLSW